MTCVVGIVANRQVWIGADSLTADTNTYHVSAERTPKVFRLDGMLIGFTTSWRMGQLLMWKLKLPNGPKGNDTHRWLATTFVDAVRECLKAGGFATKDKEVESGGQFLIGFKGHLYRVFSDYQVGEPGERYDAVGSGMAYALGAMHATRTTTWPPRRRPHSALVAAAYHSAYVRGPFRFLSVP